MIYQTYLIQHYVSVCFVFNKLFKYILANIGIRKYTRTLYTKQENEGQGMIEVSLGIFLGNPNLMMSY